MRLQPSCMYRIQLIVWITFIVGVLECICSCEPTLDARLGLSLVFWRMSGQLRMHMASRRYGTSRAGSHVGCHIVLIDAVPTGVRGDRGHAHKTSHLCHCMPLHMHMHSHLPGDKLLCNLRHATSVPCCLPAQIRHPHHLTTTTDSLKPTTWSCSIPHPSTRGSQYPLPPHPPRPLLCIRPRPLPLASPCCGGPCCIAGRLYPACTPPTTAVFTKLAAA